MWSKYIALGLFMVASGLQGCTRQKPKLTMDSEISGRIEQSQFAVVNYDLVAGDTLFVEGKFRVSETDRKFPVVVLEIVGIGDDGKPSVFNSAIGRTEKSSDGEYSYQCEIKGPSMPGSYDVRARSGVFEIGTDFVTVRDEKGG